MLSLSCVVHGPIYGRFMGFYVNGFLSYVFKKVYQGWALQQSDPTDPPKENGRKFTPTVPVTSKFRLGNTIVLLSICYLAFKQLCTESKSKVANLCNLSRLKPLTEPWLAFHVTIERWRHGLRLKLLTLGVGDNVLLALTSIPKKENNGSKRLSSTPSVSNLSLRPCRYLSIHELSHLKSLYFVLLVLFLIYFFS